MTTAIIVIVAVVVFLCVYTYINLKLPEWKGRYGERQVSKKLRALPPEYYIVIDDIFLPSRGNTSATQIDHVVVSNFGIFCIETKAYKGWIFGSEKQKYWTQAIFKYKNKFYNPLLQNYAHIKAIENLLGSQHLKAPIIPLVAFTRASRIKVSGTYSVADLSNILKRIQYYYKKVYSNEQRDVIHKLLVDANIVDKQMRKSHVKEIRALKKSA